MNILLLSQGIELKAQTDIAKKRYQKLDNMLVFRKLNYFFLAELFREKKYLKTKREKTKRKKTHVYDTPSEFYYKFQERWIQ